VAVWRWPQDPFLPGLSEALDPVRVAALLDELGVDGGAVQIRTRAYRPGRRAVVEVTGRRGRLFLKIVRPSRIEQLHRRHRTLVEHLPVPDSLGWSNSGILVLTALAGETLRAGLRSTRQPLPQPEAISQLLGRFPAQLASELPPRDLASLLSHHTSVIEETVPAVKDKLEATLEALTADPEEDPGPVTAVHGDLYEAQLMVNRGRITGILDIDTAGSGFLVDDYANFCAHLSVLAQMSDRPRQVRRFGANLLAHAETLFPRQMLRQRIAAAVLGLATGPFRVLEANWEATTARRLDLAMEWARGSSGR
jgi:aminoglycoside phosphotransferase (APT) family kinase protein